MTEPRDILTTIRHADRAPSTGRQLSMDGTGDLVAPDAADTLRICRWHGLVPRDHWCATAPQPLNLWDTSADSIPETWSTPR